MSKGESPTISVDVTSTDATSASFTSAKKDDEVADEVAAHLWAEAWNNNNEPQLPASNEEFWSDSDPDMTMMTAQCDVTVDDAMTSPIAILQTSTETQTGS